MCGFVGIVGDRSDDVADDVLDRAAEAIRHRGPDSVGVNRFEGAGLAHARLRVMDLRTIADQPFESRDGQIQTLFNGEIYNFRELRSSLQDAHGIEFLTDCDTEVVARGYEVWGDGLFAQLNGMFAIAITNLRTKTVVLARDRFGIKPLYYARDRGSIAFGSEPAALIELLRDRPSICRQSLFDFISLRAVPAPNTLFNGIFALEPGHLLEVDSTSSATAVPKMFYRHEIAFSHELDIDSAARTTDALIRRAVLRQASADVPVGALVSGGLDSSLVALAATEGGRRLPTYSVKFADTEFDESAAALLVAGALGTEHTLMEAAPVPLDWPRLMDLLGGTGQLCADPSLLALESVSGIMRRSLVVGLTGDGGDEGFGGYPHYLYMPRLVSLLERLGSWPGRALLRMARPIVSAIGRISKFGGRAERLLDLVSARGRPQVMAVVYSWVRPREMATAWIGGPVEPVARHFEQTWPVRPDARNSATDMLFAHLCELDTRIRLAGDYLIKTDLASMRHSFEMRLPLLDEDLFDFAINLPARLKASRRQGKLVIRTVIRQRLPAIADLPKRGFRVPLRDWLPAEARREAVRHLTRRDHPLHGFIRPAWIREVMTAFEDGTGMRGVTRQGVEIRALMLMTLEAQLCSGRAVGVA